MPSSYGGVTFNRQHEGFHALPVRTQVIESTHIPYTNRDDVQFGGLGNQKLEMDIILVSDSAYNTLVGFLAAAMTTRDLSTPGADGTTSTTSGWMLRALTNPRRAVQDGEARILCSISLEREQA